MAKILWKLSLCVPFISKIEVLTALFENIFGGRRKEITKKSSKLDRAGESDLRAFSLLVPEYVHFYGRVHTVPVCGTAVWLVLVANIL